jgi:myxalamid-type nonribosomal peptide synthetase MxaA
LMLQSLAEHSRMVGGLELGSLKTVIVAGEQLRITPEMVDFFAQLPECSLHNHYGPTETHVVTSLTLADDPRSWPVLPSIGRPITNTQIYILDSERKPVPVGVSGEIYIGGANVACGYLGRPDLTEERFLRDPFKSDPKARLYKTGDLGRWRADGTVEYQGRNDDQVKIRGYRIELTEVEAHLAKHAEVKDAAVIVREAVPGEKRLVAYATLHDRGSVNGDQLREHLRSGLPEFMVPSVVVILESMPTTPSGKLNRRALPAPDVTAFGNQTYDAPQGRTEEALAQAWAEVLNLNRIGREDNFFELGGHSLLVLKLLFKINQVLGATLRVADIYKHSSIRQQAAYLSGAAADDRPVSLSEEAALDDDIVGLPARPPATAKTVLFTGGTGFVGRFLLAHLLHATDATVYCLIREPSHEQALSRVRNTLVEWDLWHEGFASRLFGVSGDLRLARLGLDEVTYQRLCRDVDTIYHCGTSMNHLETYAMAKSANVESAKELLKLASTERPKVINYISTLGIFGPSTTGMTRVVDEETWIDHEAHLSSRGYVASKWVAEKIFMQANARGIPCNIFRVGLVWADSVAGRYDELQRVYRVIKSSLLSGYAIQNYRFDMSPIPVDYASRAIVTLADKYSGGGGVFHISSSEPALEDVFERCNEVVGTSLELVPFYEWVCQMRDLHNQGRSMPVAPLIAYAFCMDEKTFYEHQRRIRAGLQFDCERTTRLLADAGIVTPRLSDEFLKTCVESMFARDAELRETVRVRRGEPGPARLKWERG